MKYYFIIFTSILLSVLCSTNRSTDLQNFKLFITEFSQDSAFQIQHIRFPVISELNEYDNISTDSIYKENWRHIDLRHKIDYENQEFDKHKIEYYIKHDTATAACHGIDNGTDLGYQFLKIDGHWFLVKHYDWST